MGIEELQNRIKPDLEAIFGISMTSLILTKAKMKVAARSTGADEVHKCRVFVECLGSDDKLLGMFGSLEVKEKISKWMKFIG
jgi:hypothetical protein